MRSSVAPSGRITAADVEALVLVGHEAARRDAPQPRGQRDHADEQDRADDAAPEHPDRRRRCSGAVTRANQRLNAAKNLSGRLVRVLQDAARTAPGDSVSATRPEITTEIAIVTANWR